MEKITAYFAKACTVSTTKEQPIHSYSKSQTIIEYPQLYTRHFYIQGEACSALKDAIYKCNVEQAAFWLLELCDSEMYDDLLEILLEIHTRHITAPSIEWLNAFIFQCGNFTLEGGLWLLIDLCNLYKNYGCNEVKYCGYQSQIWQYDMQLYEWLINDGKEWFDLMNINIFEYIHYITNNALQISIINNVRLIEEYVPQLEQWIKLTGRRKRRIHEIPYRLRRTCSDLKELYVLTMKKLIGCPYYDRIFTEKNVEYIIIKNPKYIIDEEEEEMYQQIHSEIFIDDIPDEWSTQDQMKSHGFPIKF
jgi:hypothetical protein